VTVDLSSTAAQIVNSNLTLTLSAADGIENATGGSQNDVLIGNALANVLTGGAGNDTLTGNDGNDTLVGGAGNDTLTGGAGDDLYSFNTNSALGSDTIVETAGNGTDTLDFSQSTTLGVTIDLSSTAAQVVTANLTLTLSAADGIENATGGSQNDVLIGNALANVLTGGAGNDSLTGGAGNDTLIGGAGNDTYVFAADANLGSDTINEAGGGIDTLDFSPTTTLGVTVDLSSTAAQVVNANLTLILSAGNVIENAIGGSHNDVLIGNSLANVLNGGPGDDSLVGNAGNDTLVGGAGNDTLIGGAGNDTITDVGGRNLVVGGTGSDNLTGGSDDDLIISGTFSYYNEATNVVNWQAIYAIMAEWTRADADYDTRVADLRSGGGLNGTFLLNSSTVFSDGAAVDTLTGGPGRDWFWAFGSDVITDLTNGGAETVN
jgi:Ca2+-binding RTX toxin-like protein